MSIETKVASEFTAALNPQIRPTELQAEVKPSEEKPTEVAALSTLELIAKQQAEAKAAELEQQEPLTHEQLEVVVQQLQDFVQTLNRGIAFSVDQDSGKDVITVTNRDTGELVRQIPSEEVLLLAARLSEATGLLVNTEV